MMTKPTAKLLAFLTAFMPMGLAFAQPGINSLYSAYGVGIIDLRNYNGYTAMGGVGVAMKSSNTVNDLNAASYAAIANGKMMFEMNFQASAINYVTATRNLSGGDVNVKRAALGFNLFKNLGTVIGMKRFSQVEYKSVSTRSIAGTQKVLADYIAGTGGLNAAYIGNGYQIGKHLSIGVNTGVIFGSVAKDEQVVLPSGSYFTINQNSFYNKFYWDAGLQYSFKTGAYNWTLGASAQPAMNLIKINDVTINDADETNLLTEKGSAVSFKYPLQYAGGITLQKGKSTISADFIRQNWAATGYSGNNFTSRNSNNYAVGYRYTSQKNTYYGKVDGISLMAGFQYDEGYLSIYKVPINTTAITAGFSKPAKNSASLYSLGVRVGQRGQTGSTLVKEKFIDFNLNLSLATILYLKGRRYD